MVKRRCTFFLFFSKWDSLFNVVWMFYRCWCLYLWKKVFIRNRIGLPCHPCDLHPASASFFLFSSPPFLFWAKPTKTVNLEGKVSGTQILHIFPILFLETAGIQQIIEKSIHPRYFKVSQDVRDRYLWCERWLEDMLSVRQIHIISDTDVAERGWKSDKLAHKIF